MQRLQQEIDTLKLQLATATDVSCNSVLHMESKYINQM